MAEYEIVDDGKSIRTKEFTEGKYNLQHIDGIMIEHTDEMGRYVSDEDYSYNYHTFANLSADSDLLEQYLNICTLDAICENYDRHTKNYGVLTDQRTGETISLCPNYDNNNTLLANYSIKPDRLGGVMRLYTEFLESERLHIRIKEVSEKRIEGIIAEAFDKADCNNDEWQDALKEILLKGIDRLKPYMEK